MRSAGGLSPSLTLIARCSIQLLLRPGLYLSQARRAHSWGLGVRVEPVQGGGQGLQLGAGCGPFAGPPVWGEGASSHEHDGPGMHVLTPLQTYCANVLLTCALS